jgi:tetratricopeptide (TPR) repeat protein
VSSSSSTTPVKSPRKHSGVRGREFVAASLLSIWVLLIVFGFVSSLEPAWLAELSKPGIKSEARTLVAFGDSFTRQKKYIQALANYQKALEINPSNLAAQVNTAACLGLANRAEDGVRLLKNCLRQNAEQPEILYYNLGMLYERLKRQEDAIEAYSQALGGSMEPHLVHARSAKCFLKLNRPEEALLHFEKALNILERESASYDDMCRRFIDKSSGDTVDRAKTAERLRESYGENRRRFDLYLMQVARQFNPIRIQLHKQVGEVLMAQSRFPEALEHFALLLEVKPNDAALLATKEQALQRMQGLH